MLSLFAMAGLALAPDLSLERLAVWIEAGPGGASR